MKYFPSKTNPEGFLVVQWLRIHLLVQGTWVQSLVGEDPTCHGATKPMCHNYFSCSATREATAMRSLCTTTKSSLHSWQLEEACMQQQRPSIAKNKYVNLKKKKKKLILSCAIIQIIKCSNNSCWTPDVTYWSPFNL